MVSQQLRVLRLLRLILGRRGGRNVRYRLYDDHVADLLAALRFHGEHASRAVVAKPAHDAGVKKPRARGRSSPRK